MGAPADRGRDAAQGRVVGAARHGGGRAAVVHHLLDVGGVPERALLRRAVPLAVLLAVHLEVVRAPDVRLRAAGHHVPDHRRAVAGVPDPLGAGPLPPDLLLLPQGVLPLVLAGACRVRGRDVKSGYSGETKLPADPPERHRYTWYVAVVFIVLLTWDAMLAFRFPAPGGGTQFGIGVGTLVMWINVDLPRGLHVLVSLVPPRVRRPRRHVLEGARPLRRSGTSSRG